MCGAGVGGTGSSLFLDMLSQSCFIKHPRRITVSAVVYSSLDLMAEV